LSRQTPWPRALALAALCLLFGSAGAQANQSQERRTLLLPGLDPAAGPAPWSDAARVDGAIEALTRHTDGLAQDPAPPTIELDLYGAGLVVHSLPGLAVSAELRRGGQVVDSAAGAADTQGRARLTWGSYLLGEGRGAAITLGPQSQIRPGDQLRVQRRGQPALQLDIPLLSAQLDPAADRLAGQAPPGGSLSLSLGSGPTARSFPLTVDAAGAWQLDLAGQVDLPAEGLRGQLVWQGAAGRAAGAGQPSARWGARAALRPRGGGCGR